ncbi:MAG: hypothetical protein RL708_397 [Bacteroidota bacterium]|jgi:SPASM domain peptide maturase of grasp-with-spasm system
MAYILTSNCTITKGISRFLLTDYQRQKLYFINDELFNLISKNPINLSAINNKIKPSIDKLISEDIIIDIPNEDINFFIPLSTEFQIPAIINDAIIDYKYLFHNPAFLEQLIELKCGHIEIRFFENFSMEYLTIISNKIQESTLESIDIYLSFFFFSKFKNELENLMTNNIRFRLLFVHSCHEKLEIQNVNIIERIIFTKQEIKSSLSCSNISSYHFSINLLSYFESQHHNTCLNRKIAIDADGNIKNCPSMAENFGNIKDTTLTEAIEKPGFKKYWNIKKDSISVCKDCEFRHVCTDCRAYLENPEDIYSKPLKCGYNPYTCEWEEWSTHPMKQKAIEYYGMQELVKKI